MELSKFKQHLYRVAMGIGILGGFFAMFALLIAKLLNELAIGWTVEPRKAVGLGLLLGVILTIALLLHAAKAERSARTSQSDPIQL